MISIILIILICFILGIVFCKFSNDILLFIPIGAALIAIAIVLLSGGIATEVSWNTLKEDYAVVQKLEQTDPIAAKYEKIRINKELANFKKIAEKYPDANFITMQDLESYPLFIIKEEE